MEQLPRYALTFEQYPIEPPIGGVGAKAVLHDRQNGMRKTTLSEHWGQTKAEALAGAKKEADEWLAKNP